MARNKKIRGAGDIVGKVTQAIGIEECDGCSKRKDILNLVTMFPFKKVTKMSDEDKKPVGYFTFHEGKWMLVNQSLTSMKDISEQKEIPPNTMVELSDGKKILLANEEGGRLIYVTMANQ